MLALTFSSVGYLGCEHCLASLSLDANNSNRICLVELLREFNEVIHFNRGCGYIRTNYT